MRAKAKASLLRRPARAAAAAVALCFLLTAWVPVAAGIPAALRPDFFLRPPALLGAGGGIVPVLLATLLLLALAGLLLALLAVPAGIGLAYARRAGLSWIAGLADLLIAVPSIVYGLLVLALARSFGLGPSLLLGAVSLAVMALPLLARGIGEALSNLRPDWWLAGEALGLAPRLTLSRVLWPSAWPAVRESLLTALGRAAGETAALLLTVGSGFGRGFSLFSPERVLPVHITELALHVPGGRAQAYAAAAVLAAAVIALEWPLFAKERRER